MWKTTHDLWLIGESPGLGSTLTINYIGGEGVAPLVVIQNDAP